MILSKWIKHLLRLSKPVAEPKPIQFPLPPEKTKLYFSGGAMHGKAMWYRFTAIKNTVPLTFQHCGLPTERYMYHRAGRYLDGWLYITKESEIDNASTN